MVDHRQEVNKRNRDLGVRKSKKKRKRSSSSDDVMITSTDNADVIITQAPSIHESQDPGPIALKDTRILGNKSTHPILNPRPTRSSVGAVAKAQEPLRLGV